jgi:hypothetical protein
MTSTMMMKLMIIFINSSVDEQSQGEPPLDEELQVYVPNDALRYDYYILN